MKKLFTLFFICLYPTIIGAVTCQSTNNGCVSYDGCGFSAYDGCVECLVNFYNNDTISQNDLRCKACNQSDNPYINLNNGQIFDNNAQQTVGQTSCPWICDTNYYKTGSSCTRCPANSTSSQGSTDITDCKCDAGYYMGGQNMNTCQTCPQHSSNCKQNGSTGLTYLTVDCDPGYTEDRDLSNKRVDCIECTRNSSLVNGTCTCNAGYYGNASGTSGSCTQCPAGYTSDPGSNTQRSNCYMDSNTEFCDANGNCMKLLHDLSGRIIAPNP